MTVGWIDDMPKQQLQEQASQLGLPVNGNLNDLRIRVKEMWIAIKGHFSSHLTNRTDFPSVQTPAAHDGSPSRKMKLKLVTEMIKNVPVLEDADPQRVLTFLIRVKEAHNLHLVTSCEFISLLLSRTSGRTHNSDHGHHKNAQKRKTHEHTREIPYTQIVQ
jgi:hypothetical protein